MLEAIRTNPLRLWSEEAYNLPAVRQDLLFRPMVLLNSPAMVRHVLVDNSRNYRRTAASIRLLRPLAGRGLLLAEGDAWRRQRRTIAPTLAPRAMPLLMRHAAIAAQEWRTGLAPRAASGPVDLLEAMQSLALDIAGRAMFSVDLGPFASEMRALLQGPGQRASRAYFFDLVLPAAIPSPRDLLRLSFRRRWMGLISRIIARRAASPAVAEARDLFDLLTTATAAEGTAGFRLLRDEVATLIIAGHETTALALFWSALLLADNPDAQSRIAGEARNLDLGSEEAAAALEHLPFTRAVVSEALRLYPPAAMIAREALCADQAGDAEIPAGATVMIAPWVLHRHRALWTEPDRFDPSRFMPGAPPPDRFAYLPFGAGPRVCVGASFALAEATLVLAVLARDYVIERADDLPVRPVVVITTHPDRAPPFRLLTRGYPPAKQVANNTPVA